MVFSQCVCQCFSPGRRQRRLSAGRPAFKQKNMFEFTKAMLHGEVGNIPVLCFRQEYLGEMWPRYWPVIRSIDGGADQSVVVSNVLRKDLSEVGFFEFSHANL